MSKRKTYSVAVLYYKEEERGRGMHRWSAQIKYWSPDWPAFVGVYHVEATGWREAHKLAIEAAKKEFGDPPELRMKNDD